MLTDLFGITRHNFFLPAMFAFVALFVLIEIFASRAVGPLTRAIGNTRVLSVLGVIAALIAAWYFSQ